MCFYLSAEPEEHRCDRDEPLREDPSSPRIHTPMTSRQPLLALHRSICTREKHPDQKYINLAFCIQVTSVCIELFTKIVSQRFHSRFQDLFVFHLVDIKIQMSLCSLVWLRVKTVTNATPRSSNINKHRKASHLNHEPN